MCCRQFPESILFHCNDYGKAPPVFEDASKVAQAILDSGYAFDQGEILFNWFKSVVSYNATHMPIFSLEAVNKADKLSVYDSLDDEVGISWLSC